MAIRFAAAFRIKDPQQLWVAIIALRGIKKSFDESPGRVLCGRCIKIQSECRKDLCRIAFKCMHLLIWDPAHLHFHSSAIRKIIRIIM